ncbi:hypothetical protein OIU79_021419 [Salix purpurea]|uniref:Uncharacterized protein n=1 Tax=Salix purpurea TaxID=77065 RepID=A0A9Q1AH09_SALPP|nr:hypothetical protein OIU79_021419 [Salix purpurea]
MATKTSSKVVLRPVFLLGLFLLITCLALQIDARQLKEDNGNPTKFDKINAEKGLGEMKNLPPFPNIPIPGIPFPQFSFPPPFDIPNVPPLPDFPFPSFPIPPIPFSLSPPA